MTIASASAHIADSPERLYDLVAGFGWTRWSPEATTCEWLDGATGPAVGARFRGGNKRGKAKWSTTCEILTADRGRELAFAVGSRDKPDTIWRYTFVPATGGPGVTGGTVVTESFELVKELGAFTRLLTRMTTGVKDRQTDLESALRTTLAGLKAEAEGSR